MTTDALHILLVDDDEIDVESVKRAFAKMNVLNPLQVAHDGVQALQMLRGENGYLAQRIGLILLDLNMPRMTGLEFLQELRSDPELHDISVVVLTTSNEPCDVTAAYASHVAGYIVKPISPQAFFESMVTISKYWQLCENPKKPCRE